MWMRVYNNDLIPNISINIFISIFIFILIFMYEQLMRKVMSKRGSYVYHDNKF